MLIFPNVEPNFAANLGISDSVNDLLPFLGSGQFPTITAGDMIQFGAAVGVGLCPVRTHPSIFSLVIIYSCAGHSQGRASARVPGWTPKCYRPRH